MWKSACSLIKLFLQSKPIKQFFTLTMGILSNLSLVKFSQTVLTPTTDFGFIRFYLDKSE